MTVKPSHVVFLAGILCASIGVGLHYGHFFQQPLNALETVSGLKDADQDRVLNIPFNNDTLTGNYLAAHFAQAEYDWGAATSFLDKVIASTKNDPQLIRRAMVIAMGTGDTTRAFALSNALVQAEPVNPLGLLFQSIEALHKQDFTGAKAIVDKIPVSDSTDFIIPVLRGWIETAAGTLNPDSLKNGSIHLFHSIYMADYLKRPDIVEFLIDQGVKIPQITPQDMDRFADFYVHVGKVNKALPLYQKLAAIAPDDITIQAKITAIQSGKPLDNFKGVKSPVDGVAVALGDMAQTLFQEYSDDSARVFAQMAVYLNPEMTMPRLLLAEIAARHNRADDAIAFYQSIPEASPDYIQAHRRAADLLEDAGRSDEALKEINSIIATRNDIDAMMQAGDIYRRNENYKKALEYYNRAAQALGDKIPAQYWTLYYVRGMAYERMHDWPKAEADLKAALAYQPNNPMVLNYLGYAWADQGLNLDESLNMIRKAVTLSPDDGYITDSLGWVLYRKGSYKEAVPYLEHAVELLPYDSTINDHLGDAYWRVGRKLEARFQWERAKNNSKDASLTAKIEDKLSSGLPEQNAMSAPAVPSTSIVIKSQ